LELLAGQAHCFRHCPSKRWSSLVYWVEFNRSSLHWIVEQISGTRPVLRPVHPARGFPGVETMRSDTSLPRSQINECYKKAAMSVMEFLGTLTIVTAPPADPMYDLLSAFRKDVGTSR
jgi:hypothetical protein